MTLSLSQPPSWDICSWCLRCWTAGILTICVAALIWLRAGLMLSDFPVSSSFLSHLTPDGESTLLPQWNSGQCEPFISYLRCRRLELSPTMDLPYADGEFPGGGTSSETGYALLQSRHSSRTINRVPRIFRRGRGRMVVAENAKWKWKWLPLGSGCGKDGECFYFCAKCYKTRSTTRN